MIRRQMGSQWYLIRQDDHARLSGILAAHLGNHLFERPADKESFVQAVSSHDAGWPLHDDEPTLDARGEPLDVFDTPCSIALKVWAASAERAAAVNPAAGLLVSLHSLALSVDAAAAPDQKERKFDMANPTSRFEINKFQHRQVELQESLRKTLGLGTDLPLNQGLAIGSELPAEQSLIFQFRLLQAMDMLSLTICCTKPPITQIRPVLARPGGRALSLRVRRFDEARVHLSPWPFDVEEIQLQVPFRRLEDEPFSDESVFRQAYASAPIGQFGVTVAARR
jgi:hypothetical protein